jgi:hypothetical protein
MGGLSSILDRFRNVCGPYLFHNGFSTHPAKGKVVGAWSWQVVSMLNHWAFISAHLLFFSGFTLFVFVPQARLQICSVVWSASPLTLPVTWRGCSARADGLLPAVRGCIDSLQLRTVGKQLGATLWSSAGMRALLYSHPPVTATLSLSLCTIQTHIWP